MVRLAQMWQRSGPVAHFGVGINFVQNIATPSDTLDVLVEFRDCCF